MRLEIHRSLVIAEISPIWSTPSTNYLLKKKAYKERAKEQQGDGARCVTLTAPPSVLAGCFRGLARTPRRANQPSVRRHGPPVNIGSRRRVPMPFAGPPCARVTGFSSPASLDTTCVDNKDDRPPLCAILRAVSTDRERRTMIPKIGTPRAGNQRCQPAPARHADGDLRRYCHPRALARFVRPSVVPFGACVRSFLPSFARSFVRFARSLARSLLQSFIRSFTCRLAWTL